MKLPYYYTFTLHSPLSIGELRAALVANSDSDWKPRKVATALNPDFDVRYAPRLADVSLRKYQKLEVLDPVKGGQLYPNCYLRAEERGTYCRIELKFRPFVLYSIFMAIWTTGMLVGSISISVETLLHRPLKEALYLVIFVPFYAFFWLFHWATYSSEIPKYMQRLREILVATDADGPLPLAKASPRYSDAFRPGSGPTFAP